MPTTAISSLEYKNDFFALVIRESEDRPGSYILSSGISLPKFNPIIWGRTGICSNAAFKGLQQLRADVSYFALQQGIVTKEAGIPFESASGLEDGWYQESALLIEDASPEAAQEILHFSARDLVHTILTACQRDVAGPGRNGSRSNAELPRINEHLELPGSGPIADLETERRDS